MTKNKKPQKDKEPSIFRQELKRDWNTFKSLKNFREEEIQNGRYRYGENAG